jgi:hypothetical protein
VNVDWKWSSPSDAMTEPWRFSGAVYGWAPSAPVSIKTNSGETNLPEDLDKILDSLDFAFMGEFEVHKGPIGVFVSPIYYDGTDDENFTGGLGKRRNFEVEEKVWVVDYGVSYDLAKLRLGDDADSPIMILQPYVGGRYLHDDIRMEIDSVELLDTTLSFNTPIVGLTTVLDLTGGWRLRLSGDYGGFNVDGVDNTYQVIGALGYVFEMWGYTGKAFVGYRHLHLEYEDKGVELNLEVKGPLVGFGMEF